jgi:hypothetical protein
VNDGDAERCPERLHAADPTHLAVRGTETLARIIPRAVAGRTGRGSAECRLTSRKALSELRIASSRFASLAEAIFRRFSCLSQSSWLPPAVLEHSSAKPWGSQTSTHSVFDTRPA